MSRHVRVQLVDDHEIVRSGFRHLLEKEEDIDVVAESPDGKQACRDFDEQKPDLVIMDVSLPDISGLEVMRRMQALEHNAPILMLSMHSGMVAKRAMELGARGFISKRSGVGKLVEAIHTIMDGQSFIDDDSFPDVPASTGAMVSSEPLSRRELEICMLLAEGKRVLEIAEQLHISDKTVYTHRQHIMDKLGVSSPMELVRLADRLGLTADC